MIGISIIGLGAIGERLLPIIQDNKNYEIISVFDTSIDRLKEISQRFSVKCAPSIDEMLNDEKVRAIYLAVPPKYHEELSIKILKHKKHILCEKPLAGTIEEAQRMMKVSKETDCVSAMNFPLPYGPAYRKISEIIELDILGEIKRIELTGVFPHWPRLWQVNPWIDSKDQGGFVREVFTHFIQIIHDLFGHINITNKQVVYPKNNTNSETQINAFGLVNKLPIVVTGVTGVGQKEHLSLKIYGSKKTIEFLNWRDLYLLSETERVKLDLKPYHATIHLFDEFAKAINNEEAKIIDFEAGYHAVRVIETLLLND